MSEISSGLVAVAWLAPSNYEWPSHFFSMTESRNGEPLVRLSDAEAIISDLQNLVIAENQRKQQLEAYHDTWKARAEFSYAQRDNQAKRIKELEAENYEIHRIKDGTIVAQGNEIAKQAAALKLARIAIDAHLNPCGCSNGCEFCSGKGYLSEALAAIDSLLKGE